MTKNVTILFVIVLGITITFLMFMQYNYGTTAQSKTGRAETQRKKLFENCYNTCCVSAMDKLNIVSHRCTTKVGTETKVDIECFKPVYKVIAKNCKMLCVKKHGEL
jgi:hypothetical protein